MSKILLLIFISIGFAGWGICAGEFMNDGTYIDKDGVVMWKRIIPTFIFSLLLFGCIFYFIIYA